MHKSTSFYFLLYINILQNNFLEKKIFITLLKGSKDDREVWSHFAAKTMAPLFYSSALSTSARDSHQKRQAGTADRLILPGRCTNFFSPLSSKSRSPAPRFRDTISFYLLDPLHDPRLLRSSSRPLRPSIQGGRLTVDRARDSVVYWRGILGQVAFDYKWIRRGNVFLFFCSTAVHRQW